MSKIQFPVVLVALAFGIAAGLIIPWSGLRDIVFPPASDSETDSEQAHDHEAEAEGKLTLTPQTQSSIGLKTMSVQPDEYTSYFELPAFVRELPGASDLQLGSRFDGIIREVFVSQGETVRAGQALFRMELTDPQLVEAQVTLLEAVEQAKILDTEIRRLEPTVASGAVASKPLIDARNEKQRVDARIRSKTQELLLRGLSDGEIRLITDEGKLMQSVTVTLPPRLLPPQLNAENFITDPDNEMIFEELRIRPGAMARIGDPLCVLSWHAVLAVEGQAYEKDLLRIREAYGSQLPVTVAIGPGNQRLEIPEQMVAWIASHVDSESTTYPFFVYLRNERLSLRENGQSQVVSWKWKPGQPAHILLPGERFSEQFILPPDALAVDGLQSFVFRWCGQTEMHDHDHDQSGETAEEHEAHSRADLFEPVEVTVLHKDKNAVVIRSGELLLPGDRIASNRAVQLMFALRTGSGGQEGHGHEHGHEH
jgi:membrane fusion protein, heavy metal efflux system